MHRREFLKASVAAAVLPAIIPENYRPATVPRVYQVNECDTVVAFSPEEARQHYMRETELPADEAIDEKEFHELSPVEMQEQIRWGERWDKPEVRITMAEGLRRALAEGCIVPFCFTSTEW